MINSIGQLGLRLWVAQFFIFAGLKKLEHSDGLFGGGWFADVTMNYPLGLGLLGDEVNWFLATTGELVFGTALLVGVATRLNAAALLFVTFVAVYAPPLNVHWAHGWAGWDNISGGFQVPLMAAVMLLAIIASGPGKISVDNFIGKIDPTRFFPKSKQEWDE